MPLSSGRSALRLLVYREKPDVLGKWALDIRNIGSSLALFPLLETGASPFLSAKYKQAFCHVCQVLLKASGGANCKTLQAGAVKATSPLLRKWTLACIWSKKQTSAEKQARTIISLHSLPRLGQLFYFNYLIAKIIVAEINKRRDKGACDSPGVVLIKSDGSIGRFSWGMVYWARDTVLGKWNVGLIHLWTPTLAESDIFGGCRAFRKRCLTGEWCHRRAGLDA